MRFPDRRLPRQGRSSAPALARLGSGRPDDATRCLICGNPLLIIADGSRHGGQTVRREHEPRHAVTIRWRICKPRVDCLYHQSQPVSCWISNPASTNLVLWHEYPPARLHTLIV